MIARLLLAAGAVGLFATVALGGNAARERCEAAGKLAHVIADGRARGMTEAAMHVLVEMAVDSEDRALVAGVHLLVSDIYAGRMTPAQADAVTRRTCGNL